MGKKTWIPVIFSPQKPGLYGPVKRSKNQPKTRKWGKRCYYVCECYFCWKVPLKGYGRTDLLTNGRTNIETAALFKNLISEYSPKRCTGNIHQGENEIRKKRERRKRKKRKGRVRLR